MDNRICKGRFLCIVCLSLLCVLPLCAQNKAAKAVKGAKKTAKVGSVKTVVEEIKEDPIFEVQKTEPQFPGGVENLTAWLTKNIKYPSICRELDVQGFVYASFVVQKDGTVDYNKIIMSPDRAMSKEVERVLKIMPFWKPGTQNGEPVRVKYTVPIVFQLEGQPEVQIPSDSDIMKIERELNPIPMIRIYAKKEKRELLYCPYSLVRDSVKPAVEEIDEARIFEVNEQNPAFPGGDEAYLAFLAKNIKYPETSRNNGAQGTVYAAFIVEKDGSITDIEILESPDSAISKEVERVLKLMPRWKPGMQGGKPVRVKYSVPVRFQIDEKGKAKSPSEQDDKNVVVIRTVRTK